MTEAQRLNILMAKKIAGEADSDELAELEHLLLRSSEMKYAFSVVEEISGIQEAAGFTPEEEAALLASGRLSMEQWLQEQPAVPVKRRPLPWKTISVAAGICLLVTVAWYKWPSKTTAPIADELRDEVATTNGAKSRLVLPDGSTVMLNACSQLRYDSRKFLEGKREAVLIGEGYFDIKHDPGHPFVLHTGKVAITVLGTAFNVKAYSSDATVETTLINGKVEVAFPDPQSGKLRKVLLNPLEKLTFNNTDNTPRQASSITAPVHQVTEIAPVVSNTQQATAWLNDTFSFEKTSFEDLSHDLERWYDVTIIFKNEIYKKEVFTGAFRKQGLTDILQALQLMSGFRYKFDTDKKEVCIW
jgi:ferric-dicitrate binding protein FerR (iron transport regulator)